MELYYLVIIVGVPLAVAGLVTFMKKRKISAMMKERKQSYIELAESWKDSDVVEFNPTDLITEEVFLDMIGDLKLNFIETLPYCNPWMICPDLQSSCHPQISHFPQFRSSEKKGYKQ